MTTNLARSVVCAVYHVTMTSSALLTMPPPSSIPLSTTLRIPLPLDGGIPPSPPLRDDPRRELKKLPPDTPLPDRIFLRTELDDFGCWVFGGAVHSGGYGVVNVKGKIHFAHRVSFVALVGEIPDLLLLDHRCRDRLCVRPGHLQPVTNRENTWGRGEYASGAPMRSHCPLGHEFTEENTYWRPDGAGRACRACIRRRSRL